MNLPLLTTRIQFENDVVAARQRTRQIAEALGFDVQHQTRLATAASEIARNAFCYGGGGRVEFSLEGATAPQLLIVKVTDKGTGIARVDQVLDGTYRSQTGMGLGIVGARRLMDQFRLDTSPERGTTVTMGKLLPARAPLITRATLPQLMLALEKQRPRDILDEFREQNRELLQTLDELRKRQDELTALNRELEDTNRGVVALYAELDEKADSLRRADEMKSRFLSNMSHEFRTPLNSITALSRLLLERSDGDLTGEQEVQVTYIRKSAECLSELVNDLLDIAKVEAGKTEVRPTHFEIADLFGALRGMLRPLLLTSALNLVFDDPAGIPAFYADEGKVSQILRNFISNALKFTEAGEVRVSAAYDAAADYITLSVRDTGIGIEPQNRETIFLEFAQIDSPLQRKFRGTGLGLPLSKRLAQLLGGDVDVQSEPGAGSIFSLRIPAKFSHPEPVPATSDSDDRGPNVLLVEDNFETRLAYEKYLRGTQWHMRSARSIHEAEGVLRHLKPVAIVLDISLNGEDSWNFLARLKSDPATKDIAVIIATVIDDRSKAFALGADEYLAKPVTGQLLRDTLDKLAKSPRNVLIVDDEAVARYLAKQLFAGASVHFTEAANGRQAIDIAKARKPHLIVMDLIMPQMDGFAALEILSSDSALRDIPVIISTSKVLSPEEKQILDKRALAVISKTALLTPETAETLASTLRSVALGDIAGPARASA